MDSTKKHKVEILDASIGPQIMTHGIYVHETQTLLANLLEQKVDIDHSCDGNGTCGTCHVFVEKGLENLSEPEELEQDLRKDRNFAENERLACQAFVRGDIKITLR
ncbi:MAG: 2Fe-2S iron-sulfur cluster-binding protein [Bdellovibrionales bacterium]